MGEDEDQHAQVEWTRIRMRMQVWMRILIRMTIRLTITSIVINQISIRCNRLAILCHLFTNRDEL